MALRFWKMVLLIENVQYRAAKSRKEVTAFKDKLNISLCYLTLEVFR